MARHRDTRDTLSISELTIRRHKKEWAARCRGRYHNERLVAKLAFTIRELFPAGEAGESMFCVYIEQHLEGCKPRTMLEKAVAYKVFSEGEWNRLGGWQGLSFLGSLTVNQRRDVLALLVGAGPFHYQTIIKRAGMAGIQPPRSPLASPEAEQRAQTVMGAYIMRLALEGTVRSVPPDVLAALPQSKKRVVERALAAAA